MTRLHNLGEGLALRVQMNFKMRLDPVKGITTINQAAAMFLETHMPAPATVGAEQPATAPASTVVSSRIRRASLHGSTFAYLTIALQNSHCMFCLSTWDRITVTIAVGVPRARPPGMDDSPSSGGYLWAGRRLDCQ